MDEPAPLVGSPGAIGVAIEQETQVVAAAGEHAERLVDVRPDGLRVHAAEVGVALLMDFGDPDPAPCEEAADPAGSGTPHGFDQDVHVGGLERVEVERPAQELLVARERIEPLDEARGFRVRERTPGDRLAAVPGDLVLEHGEDVGSGGGAGRRLDLEAVVGPRVVTGGDDDARCGSPLDDLVGAHLGRHRVGGEGDRNVVGEDDFGCRGGEMLGREPSVVGDDDALRLLAPLDDVARDAVGATAHVLECVLVRDLGPPAVRAEDDRRRGRLLDHHVGHDLTSSR